MKTNVHLEVLGLCIVTQPAEDGPHTVIAVEPPEGSQQFPSSFQPILAYSAENSSLTDWELPQPRILQSRSYNRIPAGMSRIKIPRQTTVSLSTPSGPLRARHRTFKPATISNLGFNSLKHGIGQGSWQNGEAARFFLPFIQDAADWGLKLNERVQFYSQQEPRDVADLFFWNVSYNSTCHVTFSGPGNDNSSENKNLGVLTLNGTVELRIACYSDKEPRRGGKPFAYSSAFAPLCEGSFHPPTVEDLPAEEVRAEEVRGKNGVRHTGSGSCPPVKG